MGKWGLPVLIAVVIAAMVGIFLLGGSDKPDPKGDDKRVGELHADQGQQHIKDGEEHAAYSSNPPTSGPHYGQPATWGIKAETIVDEILIHNLEHGGIVINYKADLDPAKVDVLKQIFAKLPVSQQFNSVKAILVPRPKNERAISLTAWTYSLHLDEPDEAKIIEFYKSHLDKGPELVP